MPIRRRILALACATLVALVVAVVPASAVGGNNVVVVENTTDGATLVNASTQVVPTPMDAITSGNVAVAVNTGCTGCHSTAVAVQILIVVGFPSVFAPGNAAVAVNGGCDTCGAFAYARQHWIQTFGQPVLGGAVRQRVDELRQQIAVTAASILPSDGATDRSLSRDQQLDAELNALTKELIQVVTDGLHDSGAATTVLLDRTEEATPGS